MKYQGKLRWFRIGAAAAAPLVSFMALLCAPTPGNAATLTPAQSFTTFNLTLSDAFGTGSFGTVKVSDLGGGTADILVNVAPNFILDTGSHFALTFSLVAGGTVQAGSVSPNPNFSLVSGSGPFGNSPFGNFNTAIQSSCTQGNCGPSNGQTLDLHVSNFAGLLSATGQYNLKDIFFAVDITKSGCTGDGCTGVVGATLTPSQVPLPAAVWLMGSILGGGAAVSAWRRRKQSVKVA